MKRLLLALGFLTTIPVNAPSPGPGDLGRAGMWFPLVGVGLGALLFGGQLVLTPFVSPLVAATLLVALWAGLTGGLHLDGLADCADGLLPAVVPERRLEIMRDPHVGAFGAIGLILFLLLKVHALDALLQATDAAEPRASVAALWSHPVVPIPALVTAPAFARWVILLVARQPAAGSAGWGAEFARGLELRVLGVAAIVPLVIVAVGGPQTLAAVLLAHLVAIVIMLVARSRLGGVTGDVLGLTVEVVELTVILTFTIGKT